MALILRRWVLIVLVGFAAIAVSLLPPEPRPVREQQVSVAMQVRDLYQVEARLLAARSSLAKLRLRQWIEREITARPLPRGETPTVLALLASDSTRAAIGARTRVIWSRLGTLDTTVAVALLLADSTYRVPLGQFLLPASANRGQCIVVVPAGRYNVGGMRIPLLDQRIAEDMGVCMLFARFGIPGEKIGRWFRQGGLNYGTWFDVAVGPSEEREDLPIRFRFQNALYAGWEMYSGGPDAVACGSGDFGRCASIILDPDPVLADTTTPFSEPSYQWRRRLGSGSAGYLSDLIREMGDQRFSRFWVSELSTEAAFQDAFGMSVGEWTARWWQGRTAGFRAGPAPGTRSALVAGGLTLAFLGLALVIGGRGRPG